MATAPISYGTDYSADQAAIERSRRYAELMQQQSMQPTETNQMAGGWVVPVSPLQGLAKAVQGFAGEYKQRQADAKEKALAAKYQSDLADVIKRGTAAQSGAPERTFQTPANEMGDEAAMQRIPATAADPSAAAGIYMSHPATQQLGLQLAQQNAQRQQWAQLLGGGQGAPGMAPQGAAPAGGGSPMGGTTAAPQGGNMLSGTGLTPQDAQAMLLADPTGKSLTEAVAKARQELFKPHVQPNGQVMQYQQLPDGSMGWAPGKGSVASAQEFANVMSPKDQQAMDQNAMQMYQAKGVDLPGYKNGMRVPQMSQQGIPQGGSYIGPQPNGRFAGDPQAILAQMQNIPDPNERAAAIQALRNQMSGQNPNPQAAAAAGTPAMQTPSGMSPQAPAPSSPAAPGLSPDQTRELAMENAKKFQGGRLANMNEYEKGLNARVTEGSNLNMRMQESLKALENFKAGGGAETYQKMAQVAQGMGMPPEVVNGLMGGGPGALAASQVFNKLAAQQAMETLKQSMGGAGRIAQAEFKVFQANNPNITTDPDAIRKIFDFNTRVYKSDLAEQAAFRKFIKTNDPADFPEYWAKESAKQGFTNPELSSAPAIPPQRRASDATPVKKYNPATGKIE